MAAKFSLHWEEGDLMDVGTPPVCLTYCPSLNCIILSRTGNSVEIIDVNSGDIIEKHLVSGQFESSGHVDCRLIVMLLYVLFFVKSNY